MNHTKIVTIASILMIFLLFSCQSGKQKEIRVENVICQPICGDDYMLGGPNAMALSDSILAIVDVKSDSMLMFFNIKTGKYLRKVGARGNGPSEFTLLSSLDPHSGSSFSFYDLNKRTFYYTNTITNNGNIQFTPAFYVDGISPNQVYYIANGQYVSTGVFENYQFYLFGADGQKQRTFGELPYRDEEEKKVSGRIRSQAYMFHIASSPSKTRFVTFLGAADILAFYQLKNDSIQLIKESIVTYPSYKYQNNPEHYMPTRRDVPMAYMSVTCSDKYVYALYSGKTYNEHALMAFSGNVIYVYTWDGDRIAMLKSDKTLIQICLSEDGKSMYAIAYDPDPILVQFSLPQWD